MLKMFGLLLLLLCFFIDNLALQNRQTPYPPNVNPPQPCLWHYVALGNKSRSHTISMHPQGTQQLPFLGTNAEGL